MSALQAQLQKLPGPCFCQLGLRPAQPELLGAVVSQDTALRDLSPSTAGMACSNNHDVWPALPEPPYKAAGQLSSLQASTNPASWLRVSRSPDACTSRQCSMDRRCLLVGLGSQL